MPRPKGSRNKKPREKFYRVHFQIEGYEQKGILDVPCRLFGVFVDSIEFIPTAKHLVSLMAACMFYEETEKRKMAEK